MEKSNPLDTPLEYKPHDYRYPRTCRQAFGDEYARLRPGLSFLHNERPGPWGPLVVVVALLLAACVGLQS